MNTDKVFTAFSKEGNELLLYRKDNDTYVDLNSENNEIIKKEDIDLQTLMYANKSINLKKHMLASSIKRKYKKDRSKLIETKNVLYGLETIVKELKIYPIGIRDYQYQWIKDYTGNVNLYIFSRKVKLDGETYNAYLNLYDKKEYIIFNNFSLNKHTLPNFGNGTKYIYANGITLESKIKQSILEKKKVYEYANELRKHKIKEYREG